MAEDSWRIRLHAKASSGPTVAVACTDGGSLVGFTPMVYTGDTGLNLTPQALPIPQGVTKMLLSGDLTNLAYILLGESESTALNVSPTNGMRIQPSKDQIIDLPDTATHVGLVGATLSATLGIVFGR